MEVHTLLICGFGSGMERSVPQILAMGHDVIAVTDGDARQLESCGACVVRANPCDADAVLRELRSLGTPAICGVLSLGNDNPETISELALALGCRALSPKVAKRCTRKDLRFRCLRAAGLRTPIYQVAHSYAEAIAALELISMPAIVKPVDGTASRGVSLVRDRVSAAPCLQEAFSRSRGGSILVEQFLEGTEHTVTAFCVDGRFAICGFADRAYHEKLRFFPYVFESGDTLPSTLPLRLQDRIRCDVESAVMALELDPAFINTDVLVTQSGDVYLLEVTARLTGARIATEVMRLSTGIDPLPNVVRLALGESLVWEDLQATRSLPVVQRFLPCSGGIVESVGPIVVPPEVHDVFWCMPLQPGLRLPDYRCADDVLAGVIASGATISEAEAAAYSALEALPLRIVDG